MAVVVGVGVGVMAASHRHGGARAPSTRHGSQPTDLAQAAQLPLRLHGAAVTATAIDERGSLLLGSSAGKLSAYAGFDLRPLPHLEVRWSGVPVDRLAVSADGSMAAALFDDDAVIAWPLPRGPVYAVANAAHWDVSAMALSSDGRLLALAIPTAVAVYETHSGRVAAWIPHGNDYAAVGFNHSDTLLAGASMFGADAWNLPSLRRAWSLRCSCGISSTAFSPGLGYLTYGTVGGHVVVYGLGRRPHVIADLTATDDPGGGTTAAQIDAAGHTLVAATATRIDVWHSLRPPTVPVVTRTDLTDQESISGVTVTADGDRALIEARSGGWYAPKRAWLMHLR